MGMNNMLNPMMGMNNQQNQMNGIFMNQMAQNTIQIYENKIRELEEIIKQKDFEINMLKQNLNNIISNNNIMNMNTTMMNMNMMPSNLMMGNMDNQNEDKKRKFYLTIISEKKREFINCFSDDKASILKEKCDLTGKLLSFNYKLIDYDLTIGENGINNGSFIYVVDIFQNIIFENKQGIKNPISLSGDCPIEFALLYYYIMIGRIDFIMSNFCNEQADLNFSFNSQKIKIGDKTPLKKFFSSYALPSIVVNEEISE